jgi:hypothetical protein
MANTLSRCPAFTSREEGTTMADSGTLPRSDQGIEVGAVQIKACYAFGVTGILPGPYRITQLFKYRDLISTHELSLRFPNWINLPHLFTYL